MGFFSKLWKSVKKIIPVVAKVASVIPGPWQPFAIAATTAMSAIGSYNDGKRAIDLAGSQRQLGERAIDSNLWYGDEGGAANAGTALTSVINADFENDPGYQLAQRAAAATSSKQPGGYSAQAASNAAMMYQNNRIQALSGPAGVGFNPAQNYQVAGQMDQAAYDMESAGRASKRYGVNEGLDWLGDWLKGSRTDGGEIPVEESVGVKNPNYIDELFVGPPRPQGA